MLMMRLQRIGRKNDPAYRIVVTDKRTGPKSNKHVDQIGSYHPKTKQTNIDNERVKHWLAQGVQTSDTVHNLLVSNGVIEGSKINVVPKKPVAEAPTEETVTEPVAETVAPTEEVPEASPEPEEKTAETKEATEPAKV